MATLALLPPERVLRLATRLSMSCPMTMMTTKTTAATRLTTCATFHGGALRQKKWCRRGGEQSRAGAQSPQSLEPSAGNCAWCPWGWAAAEAGSAPAPLRDCRPGSGTPMMRNCRAPAPMRDCRRGLAPCCSGPAPKTPASPDWTVGRIGFCIGTGDSLTV